MAVDNGELSHPVVVYAATPIVDGWFVLPQKYLILGPAMLLAMGAALGLDDLDSW